MSKNLFKRDVEKPEKKFLWSSKEKADHTTSSDKIQLNAMVETLDKINSKIAEGVTQSDLARTQLNTTGAVAPADIERIRSTLVTLMDAVNAKRNKLSTGFENVSAINNEGTVKDIAHEAIDAVPVVEKLDSGTVNPTPITTQLGIGLTQFEIDYIRKMFNGTPIDDGVIIRYLTNAERIEVLDYLKPYLLPRAAQWVTMSHDDRMKLIKDFITKSYQNWRTAKGFLRAPAGMPIGSPSPTGAGPGPAPTPAPAPAPAPVPPGPAPLFRLPNPQTAHPSFTPEKPKLAWRKYSPKDPPGAIIPQNIWIPYYGEIDTFELRKYLGANLRYTGGVAPTIGDISSLVMNPNYISQIITTQDKGPGKPENVASFKAGLIVMKVVYGLFSLSDQEVRNYDSTTTNPHARGLGSPPKHAGIFLRLDDTKKPSVFV